MRSQKAQEYISCALCGTKDYVVPAVLPRAVPIVPVDVDVSEVPVVPVVPLVPVVPVVPVVPIPLVELVSSPV